MATDIQESEKLEQLSHLNPDEIEVAAGREREQLEGWVPELATDAEVREALEKAFDYRGDVTITRKDGSKQNVEVLCRIDTPIEVDYYNGGGILPFVLRDLVKAA